MKNIQRITRNTTSENNHFTEESERSFNAENTIKQLEARIATLESALVEIQQELSHQSRSTKMLRLDTEESVLYLIRKVQESLAQRSDIAFDARLSAAETNLLDIQTRLSRYLSWLPFRIMRKVRRLFKG